MQVTEDTVSDTGVNNALRLRYRLYGLPANWFGLSYNDTDLPPPEQDRLKTIFSALRPSSVCYIQGTAAPIANQYLEAGYKVRGIDAMPYLLDPFDKDEKKPFPDADVVFIYNIGESTTQHSLTQKVIKRLVMQYPTTMVVLVGDILPRTFAKDYYNVANYVTIMNKKEDKWLI